MRKLCCRYSISRWRCYQLNQRQDRGDACQYAAAKPRKRKRGVVEENEIGTRKLIIRSSPAREFGRSVSFNRNKETGSEITSNSPNQVVGDSTTGNTRSNIATNCENGEAQQSVCLFSLFRL